MSDLQLRDPERCPNCGADSRVVDCRKQPSYRWRRRKCVNCKGTWRTYETVINPSRLRVKERAS